MPDRKPLRDEFAYAEPGEEPKLLFTVERREVIGEVYESNVPGDSPVEAGLAVIGAHLTESLTSNDHDPIRFEFQFGANKISVEREWVNPSLSR